MIDKNLAIPSCVSVFYVLCCCYSKISIFQKSIMRKQISVQPSIHSSLKAIAAQEGRSLEALANEALSKYLSDRSVKIPVVSP